MYAIVLTLHMLWGCREASDIIKKGKMCSLFINDLDAGAGRMGAGTQYTVNNQMVNATLMNIADNPSNVQLPGVYKQETIPRVPIVCTGIAHFRIAVCLLCIVVDWHKASFLNDIKRLVCKKLILCYQQHNTCGQCALGAMLGYTMVGKAPA